MLMKSIQECNKKKKMLMKSILSVNCKIFRFLVAYTLSGSLYLIQTLLFYIFF